MSIYQLCLGSEFQKLHPKIQERFGLTHGNGIMVIGKGKMDKVWRGPFYTVPFLTIGTWRNIMFPAHGKNIPFTIKNYAYLDSFGRETVTWIRDFQFPDKTRQFYATMIYSRRHKCIVDYLGTHQHLAVDIDLSVGENGGLKLRSGQQRFYEGPVGFRFPMFFSGYAEVCEWYDDESQKFRIEVKVSNKFFGELFGYSGSFQVDYVPIANIPAGAKPIREERRE